jgi:hypothetical protein
MVLMAALTSAVGFVALIVSRQYGLKHRPDLVDQWDDRVKQTFGPLRDQLGLRPAEPAPVAPPPLRRPADPRVVVFKSKRKLQLLDGKTLVREWDIRLGAHPEGPKRNDGDGRTPEGLFYVCARNSLSRHHRFIGISYPGIEDADRGLAEGLITVEQAEAIRKAVAGRAAPPPTTKLGGGLGLHGEGSEPHSGDWTSGGVALSNEAVEQLFRVIDLGDPVEIRP